MPKKRCSLLSLVALLALSGPAVLAEPASFSVKIGKQYDTWPTYMMQSVPTSVQVEALDAKGELDSSFEGTAGIEGIFVETEGRIEPLGRIGPFHGGKLVLNTTTEARYFVRASEVRITEGAASGSISLSLVQAPGWTSVLPPVLAIVLCVVTRQVFIALFVGVLCGAYLVFQYGQDASALAFLLRAIDSYLPFVVGYNAVILLFTFGLGGLIAIMARSGGTAGLVQLLAPLARSRRSGQLTTWALGMAVFFDDYANCYIVGPMMQARTDLLRISREKLAYIVDSTAAPVASIMVVSTWVGVEIGYIEDALGLVGPVRAGDGLNLFWQTLPYRFYPLLAIFTVFLVGFLLRDIGPMLRAERRAFRSGRVVRDGAVPMADKDLAEVIAQTSVRPAPWNALVPLAILVGVVLAGVIYSSMFPENSLDSSITFLWATAFACLAAGILVIAQRLMNVQQVVETWMLGAKSMVLACSILTLAWAIGQVCKDLHTGDYVVGLTQGLVSPRMVPLLTFLLAAVISFATGTSFGTMAILMPIMVPVAWALTADSGLDASLAATLRIATVGSVLAGAIFGDHCSPISDTTIMSSMGSACDHLDHVRTQMPYSLICGGLSAAGCVLVGFGISPWIALGLGAALLTASLYVFGGSVEEAETPAGQG